jgi:pimeloyl-ACP methyl ester carboxylesterase
MPHLELDGRKIAFSDQGSGDGIVLVHGFAASARENWEKPGWIQMLVRAGRRVIAIDLPGHGESGKPHDPGAYSIGSLADAVLAVTDHLEVKKPDLVGFSLGARVALEVLSRRPERYLLGVLCGVGQELLAPRDARMQVGLIDAFEAESADHVPEGLARQFRQFAEAQGQDLKALAACARAFDAAPMTWAAERLSLIRNEILVIAGSGDVLAGSAPGLARCLGNARGKQIPGCGHMDCLTQPMFKAAVMDFLAGIPDVPA